MSTGIFSIGTSALTAAYTALRTAGNNIANVNTPNYSRQEVLLSPQSGGSLAGLFVGQGVSVDQVRRVYNDFLTQQAHAAQSTASEAQTRSLQLAQAANLFSDPTSGVGAAIDQFFAALQTLAQRPADSSARQAFLSSAQLLVNRFNDVGDRLQDFAEQADRQVAQEIGTANNTAREIATLNEKIALAIGAGRLPNDLLDQRDAAIRRLSESIRVSAVEQSDGSVNLFLASGQPLVVGSRANPLALTADPADPRNVLLSAQTENGNIPLTADEIGGGEIAGLMRFRSGDLPQFENEIGRLATTLALQFNQQHRLGDDRNGAPGGDFFALAAPTAFEVAGNGGSATVGATIADSTRLVASDYRIDYAGGTYTITRLSDGQRTDAATLPDFAASGGNVAFTIDGVRVSLAGAPPANGDRFVLQPLRDASRNLGMALTQIAQIAAASPVKATIPTSNLGSVVVDSLAVQGPTRNANVAQPVRIDFVSATQYTVSINGGPASAPQAYTPGSPIDVNGWRLTLRGTPAAGDRVDVAANVGGTSDNRNALALAGLQNAAAIDGGRLGDAFAALVARVGADAQSAQMVDSAQTAILTEALNAESAVSGVNLDEEASRLMQYQQQYQAAAKVIAAAKTIFDEILALGR